MPRVRGADRSRKYDWKSRYIVNDNGCWVWQGPLYPGGYGQLWDSKRQNSIPAHTVFYEHYVGDVPKGLELDHTCRNRACVNPSHLEAVTRTTNLRRGEGTKLTEDQVREIRKSVGSSRKVAPLFGVSKSTISRIRAGTHWGDVE